MAFDRNYKGSRILVTGGAGFIGSHLSERLLAAGAEVVCADNYFTGSRKNIAYLLSNPMFEAIRYDVTFPLYIDLQTTNTSVHGAINMLGLAKRLRARSKLIFKPLPQDDPRQRQPDLSKAKAPLNWEPKVALADALKETIAYFRRSLELS
jgi:nucleoside-diphosphate-sugar epimerase